jgi:hypothetical protein
VQPAPCRGAPHAKPTDMIASEPCESIPEHHEALMRAVYMQHTPYEMRDAGRTSSGNFRPPAELSRRGSRWRRRRESEALSVALGAGGDVQRRMLDQRLLPACGRACGGLRTNAPEWARLPSACAAVVPCRVGWAVAVLRRSPLTVEAVDGAAWLGTTDTEPSEYPSVLMCARPGQARPGQARPGQARPGQARPGSPHDVLELFVEGHVAVQLAVGNDANVRETCVQHMWLHATSRDNMRHMPCTGDSKHTCACNVRKNMPLSNLHHTTCGMQRTPHEQHTQP